MSKLGIFASGVGASGPTYTYQAYSVAGPPYTSIPIGVASVDRLVVVAVAGFNSVDARTVTSVTIGGVAATLIENNSSTLLNAFAYATVPSGTTATIVVTLSGVANRGQGIGVWEIKGLSSTTPLQTGSVVNTTSINFSAATPGSIAILAATSNNLAGVSWTNATGDFDDQTSVMFGWAGASAILSGPTTISVTRTPSYRLTGAVWA